jgi:hypothetical protein
MVLGALRPPHIALADFDLCAGRLCWRGVAPGMSVETARERLIGFGYNEQYHNRSNARYAYYNAEFTPACVSVEYVCQGDCVVESVLLSCFGEMQIGDAAAQFGSPHALFFNTIYGEHLVYDQVMVGIDPQQYSMFGSVYSLTLIADAPTFERLVQPWRGFVPIGWYCQQQPRYFGCGYDGD